MRTSIIVRTYNEARYLPILLNTIQRQNSRNTAIEVVIVDSGSTDNTLEIARSYDCITTHIEKNHFTFGRSLNFGCDAARGENLVFVSGHCIPVNDHWLMNLVRPLSDGICHYAYGRQMGHDTTKFSERQVFEKYYPDTSSIPQNGFFCNNANAAILKCIWEQHPFDEELTGLEDMHLARRLVENGMRVAYIADAPVYHIHDESWFQVQTRYEREAIAMREVMPEVHITLQDFLHYFTHAVYLDTMRAVREKSLFRNLHQIILFRLMQYWGTYRGYSSHKPLSKEMKQHYFYPKNQLQDALATRRGNLQRVPDVYPAEQMTGESLPIVQSD